MHKCGLEEAMEVEAEEVDIMEGGRREPLTLNSSPKMPLPTLLATFPLCVRSGLVLAHGGVLVVDLTWCL